jgi:hypothetical protein
MRNPVVEIVKNGRLHRSGNAAVSVRSERGYVGAELIFEKPVSHLAELTHKNGLTLCV